MDDFEGNNILPKDLRYNLDGLLANCQSIVGRQLHENSSGPLNILLKKLFPP